MNERDEDFLRRWSRRKIEAKRGGARHEEPDPAGSPTHSGHANASAAPSPSSGSEAPAREDARPLTEADFADVDFDLLDAESDYSRFLGPNVPQSIKNKALRKLWASSEVFAQVEPFQDYAEDYTDAARAVATGALKTAYRIGRGFLTDEEAAEWEKLGDSKQSRNENRPVPAASEDAAALEQAPQTADKSAEGEETDAVRGTSATSSAGPDERGSSALEDRPEHRESPTDKGSKA